MLVGREWQRIGFKVGLLWFLLFRVCVGRGRDFGFYLEKYWEIIEGFKQRNDVKLVFKKIIDIFLYIDIYIVSGCLNNYLFN